MTEKNHTPLPWYIGDIDEATDQINVMGAPVYGFYVCGVIPGADSQVSNAEFIVRACNSHYELLEALRMVIDGPHDADAIADMLPHLRAVLAKAEDAA